MESATAEKAPSGELVSPGPAEGRARRLGELSRGERWLLLALVLGGAVLRIVYHWGRPLSGDEIGTLIFLKEDFGVLLTEFRSWLTMNYYMAALKVLALACGKSPWVLALPSLVAGVAVVPLVAAITLRLSSARHALLAAALTAYNPFLVLYSTQVRSYMLLLLFALLALLWLLDWQREPRWSTGWKVALASAAAVLIHANGIYQVGALAVLLVRLRRLDQPRNWDRAQARQLATVLVPSALVLGAALLAYLPLLDDMADFRKQWSYTAPTNVAYLPHLFENYFGGRYGSLATLLLLVAGLWRASQENRALLDLGLLVGVPMILTSLLGVSHYPWAYARFLIPILPVLIVLIAFACRHEGSRTPSFLLACVALVAWLPAHTRNLAQKRDYPWTAIADQLEAEARTLDGILAIDQTIELDLSAQDRGYESLFMTAERLVTLEGRVRLLVLTEKPHLVTSAQNHAFGVVQAVVYRGASAREVVEALAHDIEQTTKGRIRPELTNHYKQIYEIHAALGHEFDAMASMVLVAKCQNIYNRERMRPLQLP